MAKQKKRTPTPVKRRKAIPRARAVAQPPPDNPAWRQQDHLLARLTDSDNGTESPATAAHAELSSGARSLAPIDIVRAPKRVRPQGQLAQARLRLSALSEKSSLFDDDTSSARSPVMLGASNWVQLGPTAIPNGQTYGGARVLVTGRVTAIAVDPTNHQVIYVGAARGGVWKTIDGGRHWTAKSDNEVSLAIGALAIAPSDTQVIYVGTGEGNLERYVQSYALSSSPDNYLGNGVLKSTDGGDTWTNQGAANLTGAAFYGIAVHPTNANIAYAATSSGLFRTTDGGNNWTALSNGLPAITTTIIGATDVAIHPSAPDTVYAAFFADGVYKTTNSGAANPSWTKQTSVLPAGGVGRIALSVSPSSPSTVYALFSDGAESIKGIFRSTTGGGTWTSLGIAAASLANITGSSSYTLNIAVDPTTPDIVYISGTSLFKAVRNTLANAWSLTEIGANIHPDNHAFAFDPASHLSIYAGSDGGIYKSIDGGATWSDSINRGLCITQFEMIDHHPTSDAVLIGGTQDNGTEAYRNSPVFYHADEGDGGFVAIDQAAPTNMLHEYYTRTLARSTQAGKFGSWLNAAGGLSGNGLFYPPFALDQTNSNNIAYGTDRICLDGAQGTGGWHTSVTLPGLNGAVSAITYLNSNLLYAGTTTGQIYKLAKSGTAWTATAIHAAPFPNRWVWDLAARPGAVNTLYAAVSGFGTGHVWRGVVPATGAAVWTDLSGTPPGRLPDIPANSLAMEPSAPNTLYVGSDIGVFRTTNEGSAWTQFSPGLPNCAIYDLRLHAPSRLLRAGTHGRGIWERRLDLAAMPEVDIFLRDHLMDSGRVSPSPAGVPAGFDDPTQYVTLGEPLQWYMCADIKVDALEGFPPNYQMNVAAVDYLAFETVLQHRNAQRGNVNRVYVQVHNRGTQPATNVIVKVLFANATAGLPPLPSDFWTVFPANASSPSAWTPIGKAQVIPALSPLEPVVLEWNWSTPAAAADHTCLLVVTDCPADPLTAGNKGFNVDQLVLTEKRVGLKNLHIVNAAPGTAYWTPFEFWQRADLPQAVRFRPSTGGGWQVGVVFAAGTQPALKLTGFTRTKPAVALLTALRARLGGEVGNYDTTALYMLTNLAKGGALENVAIPNAGLRAMLLFVSPKAGGRDGVLVIEQEEDHKAIVGGSKFVLHVARK